MSTYMQSRLERARDVMPGGSFNSVAFNESVDLIIAKGEGSKVTDLNGKQYFDCINGSGPMLLGHAYPEVIEAITKAAQCPSNFYMLNDTGIQLAEKLVEVIPCADQIKYGISGSDATLFAMRLARAATKKSKILKFEGGFIGVNDYALMGMGPKVDQAPYPIALPDSAGIPPVIESEVLIAPFNDIFTTSKIIQEHQHELAAVIVEAQHRCIDPKPGFLEALRGLTEKLGIILIFDEVVTGFRLAYGGAQEKYGIIPDMATYGKVIGGGLPLSAVAGSKEIMALCDPRQSSAENYCYISSTMSGNPVAAAAGLATINVLSRPGTYDRLNEIGNRFRKGVKSVFEKHGLKVQLPGSGPLTILVISDDEVIDYRTTMKGDQVLHRKIMANLLRNGVLTHGKFYISLAFSDKDIDEVVSIIDYSVHQALNN